MDIITRQLRGTFDKRFHAHLKQLSDWGFIRKQHNGETYMVAPEASIAPETIEEIRAWGWKVWIFPWIDKGQKQRLTV
jgi:hypothetical protein